MNDDIKTKKYLNTLKENLLNSKKLDIEISRNWNDNFPRKAGVYVFFENDTIVYVGETTSLKDRMKDVLRTLNHTLRRKIGEHNFLNHKNYTKASSITKYHPDIESKVDQWFTKKMKMSFLPVPLGRKELEELLVKEYNPKYNSKTRRGK